LPRQVDLFDGEISKAKVLREIILSMPHGELRKGHTWHIGNVKAIDENSIYFAFGKTTKTTHPIYDDLTGDFTEMDYDTAPYTHVFLDLKYQVIAIAKKSALAQKVKSIGFQLKKLINRNESIQEKGYEVDVIEISDPDDFIKAVNSSYTVCKFNIDFGLPNPWDVEEDFQRPLEKFVVASNAAAGKVSVAGSNLNKECVANIARSAASTGNNGYADLRYEKDGRKVRSYLQGNPAVIRFLDIGLSAFQNVVNQVRSEYEKIRRDGNG
jgi:hypothetical protein